MDQVVRGKYLLSGHPAQIKPTCHDSSVWKAIRPLIPVVISNTGWRLKEGQVSIWHDDWSGLGAIEELTEVKGLPNGVVADLVNQTKVSWNVQLLIQLLGDELSRHILDKQPPMRMGPDIPIWKPEANGIWSADLVR